MNSYRYIPYTLVLALWVGGIAAFTFVVTPVILKSYPRDTAGDIVGKLFPAFFSCNLLIAIVALILFLVFVSERSNRAYHLSLFS